MVGKEGVERGLFFDIYGRVPPWETGRPQPVFVELAERGEIRGSVLDVGCGTGENALFLAQRGHEVWGVDIVPQAIERARAKAAERGVSVEFRVHDALELAGLGREFDTVIDCGLFHVFSDADRRPFEQSVASVLRPGGRLLLLCFSESETSEKGPRRVTRDELRATFADGWYENYIVPARFESHLHEGGARAWLASFERLPGRGGREHQPAPGRPSDR
jgi:SAM-dependent methyltransferase